MSVTKKGENDVFMESYRVVDDVIVFSGKESGKDYAVAARYTMNDKLLSLKFSDMRVVLEEVEEQI
jgi:hypothetical protein